MTRTLPRPKTTRDVLEDYQRAVQERSTGLARLGHRWNRLAYARGGLFLLALALAACGLADVASLKPVWVVLATIAFLGFLITACYHEGVQRRIERDRLQLAMDRESIARIERKWDRIQVPEIEIAESFRPVARDLDLFGESSLFKLLGTPRTPLGIQTLGQWIVEGAPPEDIPGRQAGVRELTHQVDYRREFRLHCAQLHISRSGPSQFIEWAEAPAWLSTRRWLLGLARLTSLATVVGLASWLTGLLPPLVAGSIVLTAIGINFLLSVLFAGAIHERFNQISSHRNEIGHYVRLFEMVIRFPARSDKLLAIQQALRSDQEDVRRRVGTLGQWVWLANLRRNGVLFLGYLVFEFLFFWDVHILDRLERWKRAHGSQARRWFTALGEWETMLALSKLAHDQPEWVFPKIRDRARPAQVSGIQLGHPLLDDSRVPNDVTVGPPETVLLVTGSNMSGKSTLLRSIGVNVVLAQMGSVVCAKSMECSPLRVETSMRIADSLADGVSFFMAELKRLKQVVDIARDQRQIGQRTMLFLLDEILQGTNSRERQIAVSRVVRKLVDEQAIGAISTHDLDLAGTPELRDAVRAVHFSEQFTEREGHMRMTFDYHLRPGLASSTNALKLLELVGLGKEPDA